MRSVTVSEARKQLYRIVEEAELHPVELRGRKSAVVVVSRDDWNALQETLYLQGIPGMWESLRAGAETPRDEWIPLEDVTL